MDITSGMELIEIIPEVIEMLPVIDENGLAQSLYDDSEWKF